jgi:hypothetical protein
MNGTFDGVPLRNITPVKTISLKGSTPDTFRVVGGPFPPLERHLRSTDGVDLSRVDT